MSNEQNTPNQAPAKKGKRKLIALATGTALVVGGAFGVQAFADSKTYQHMTVAASDGGSWHGKGRHGRRGDGHRMERMTEAEMEAKVTRMMKHAAIEIDATPEQTEKMTALATAVAKDLMPLRKEMRAVRAQMQSLLTAETIDRDAIEALRAERLAEMDRISETVTVAAADVAEVLTPEQRKMVNDRIEQFTSGRGGRRGGHRGWFKH